MADDRETILSALRRSLGRNRAALEALAGDAPAVRPQLAERGEALLTRFLEELRQLSATGHPCSSAEQVAATIAQLMAGYGARQALAWNPAALPLSGLGAQLATLGLELVPAALSRSDSSYDQLAAHARLRVSISGADAGIAQSGSIALLSGPGRPRSASLLAPVHIALLRQQDLVPTLEDAVDLLRQRFGQRFLAEHSNLSIISGPSRTADIEQTLTLGAHGPREVHVLVLSF